MDKAGDRILCEGAGLRTVDWRKDEAPRVTLFLSNYYSYFDRNYFGDVLGKVEGRCQDDEPGGKERRRTTSF